MGTRVTVVGGGSTYTPELVDGFVRRADRLPIDELVLLDTDPDRLDVVGGLAQRMLDRLDWTGRLQPDRRSRRGARRRRLRAVPAAGRWPGRAARRRDAPPPSSGSSARRRRARVASPRRCARSRSSSSSPSSSPAARRPTPGSSTSRTRSASSPRRSSTTGTGRSGCATSAINLQRRMAALFDVEPERVELEHVGLNHLTWERAVRVDGVDRLPELLDAARRAVRRGIPPAGRHDPRPSAPSRPTTCATTS